MPELPEVQTVVNALEKLILNKKIIQVHSYRTGTIRYLTLQPISFPFIIHRIFRKGKYIIFQTNRDFYILAHLRMTGKFIYQKEQTDENTHIRASLQFDDQSVLLFKDVRCFGSLVFVDHLKQSKGLQALGVEPLGEDFSVDYLIKQLKKRSAPIKNVLLNQHIIAGLGNIYVTEILFRSQISPLKKANQLNKKEIQKIVRNTKDILQEAIRKNGTTILDFRNVDEKTGEFQGFLQMYQKKKCLCGNLISRIKQAGRTTYYCELCQK